MGLDRLVKRNEENVKKRQEYARSRAKEAIEQLVLTDQFKIYASLPEAKTCIDKIVSSTIETNINPVSQYIDTLRSMGLRQGQIRHITHNWYCTYIDVTPNADNKTYEEMVDPVAQYVYAHQELYNTINLDILE